MSNIQDSIITRASKGSLVSSIEYDLNLVRLAAALGHITAGHSHDGVNSKIILGTLPTGGNAGQVLAKVDSADFHADWIDQTGGGATIEIDIDPALTANSDALVSSQKAVKAYVDGFIANTDFLPVGGGIGQVLVKHTSADGDAEWADQKVSGHGIEDETTPVAARASLSFVGDGVKVADDAGGDKTVVTIPGWAVGGIFVSILPDNPATALGYGTWVLFGAGRLVLDVDTGADENLSSRITVYLWKRVT